MIRDRAGWTYIRRIGMTLRLCAVAIVAMTLVSIRGDAFALDAAQIAAAPHRYDLVGWHLGNILTKWVHRAGRSLPGRDISEAERLALVGEYFHLGRELARLRDGIDGAAAQGIEGRDLLEGLEAALYLTRARRIEIRPDVEEAIESVVSTAIRREGMAGPGPLVLPPVDIRLAEPPKVLVTSPRNRIERLTDVLLDSDVTISDRERIEAELMDESDLSAAVLDVGGVATYPASVFSGADLQWTLQTVAHEWLHHCLFFRPIGRNMRDSPEMVVLNETVADLAGREIGDSIHRGLVDAIPQTPHPTPVEKGAASPSPRPAEGFDFNAEMRETRLETDRLLAKGEVEKAEAYMDSRRRLFVYNGYPIRKLNQAYFAFSGTYAESPASINPIGAQVRQLREASPDVGTFLRLVSGVSDYGEFLQLLADTT